MNKKRLLLNNIDVLSSFSKGNAVVYRDKVMVDCGVPYKLIQPYLNKIKFILLTHQHTDHIKFETLSKLNIKIFAPSYLSDLLNDNHIEHTPIEINKLYNYQGIKFSAFKLYHNVPNAGYRIFDKEYKIFHATDTASLDGITAKNYDLYAIEHNYDAATIQDIIDEKLKNHKYCYEAYAVDNHMSFQTAKKWLDNNIGLESEVHMLHISSRYYIDGKLELPKELL